MERPRERKDQVRCSQREGATQLRKNSQSLATALQGSPLLINTSTVWDEGNEPVSWSVYLADK
ncbi:hypothetical protein BJX62DRAFT_202396 [Aspergillus germanicus]